MPSSAKLSFFGLMGIENEIEGKLFHILGNSEMNCRIEIYLKISF